MEVPGLHCERDGRVAFANGDGDEDGGRCEEQISCTCNSDPTRHSDSGTLTRTGFRLSTSFGLHFDSDNLDCHTCCSADSGNGHTSFAHRLGYEEVLVETRFSASNSLYKGL